MYAFALWLLACAHCGEPNLARLKAVSHPPWLARLCWLAHVLSLTPTMVELVLFVAARGKLARGASQPT